VQFEIVESRSETGLNGATVSRAKAICWCCKAVVAPDRVRSQIASQRGGAEVIFNEAGKRIGGARLLAVSTLRSGQTGRHSRLPTEADYEAVWKAQQRLEEVVATKRPDGLNTIPDEPTPRGGGSGAGRAFSVQKYGMRQWGDLFTARQKVGLAALANITHRTVQNRNDVAALAIGKLVDLSNALCTWIPQRECPSAVFKLGRVKTGWDFPESVLLSDSSGSYSVCVENLIAGVFASVVCSHSGQVSQLQAQESSLPDESVSVWFTDPPYYDAIPYADLSDFFFVWLKRTLPGHPLLRDPFDSANQLSPKVQEAVLDETIAVNGRPKDRMFFEETMAKAFAEGRRILREDGIGSVVFGLDHRSGHCACAFDRLFDVTTTSKSAYDLGTSVQ
jgi:putative DNA methylase